MVSGRPLARLQALAQASANGELICAAPQIEIHVYLQRGRIAWATDSRHPFAFASHLRSTARIDDATLRQVVEECRRERLPLGETLVEWGLATWDEVRTSLAHQIEIAVKQLASLDLGQTLFLERSFSTYHESLTFELGAFVTSAAEPWAGLAPPQAPATTSASSGLARQIRDSIGGLTWVEVLDDDHVVDGYPACPSVRVPLALVRATVLDGCDFVAIRSARSSVVGLGTTRPRSIWCRLSAGSTFGGVVSAIWSVAGTTERPLDPAPARPTLGAWALGDAHGMEFEALRSFQERATEVLGAIVLDDHGQQPVAGAGCSLVEPTHGLDIARRRVPCLVGDTLPLADTGEHALDSIGFALKTMVSGEPRHWCFGAELGRGETLWMFLDRRTSQGLGWAYLTALTRALTCARGSDA